MVQYPAQRIRLNCYCFTLCLSLFRCGVYYTSMDEADKCPLKTSPHEALMGFLCSPHWSTFDTKIIHPWSLIRGNESWIYSVNTESKDDHVRDTPAISRRINLERRWRNMGYLRTQFLGRLNWNGAFCSSVRFTLKPQLGFVFEEKKVFPSKAPSTFVFTRKKILATTWIGKKRKKT